MTRNSLYVLIALLSLGVIGLGYLYYQESRTGIDIQIDNDGVKIEGN